MSKGDHMPTAHTLAIADADQHGWWHRIRFEMVCRQLEAGPRPFSLVDVGCSAGGLLLALKDRFADSTLIGVEATEAGAALAMARGCCVEQMEFGPGSSLPLPDPDYVTLLDVLEHVEDDEALLRALFDQVGEDSRIIITVPACPWLFSNWDRRLGHHRRYSRCRLGELVVAAGRQPRLLRHLMTFVLMPALARRLRRSVLVDSDLTFPPVHRSLNELLVRVGVMEAKLLPGQLWGTSLLCVC